MTNVNRGNDNSSFICVVSRSLELSLRHQEFLLGLYGRKEDNSRREHDTILTVRPWRIARRNCHRIVSSGGLEAELSSISSPMADASKRNRPEKRSFVTVTVAGSSKENLCPQHCDEDEDDSLLRQLAT